ncbi:ribonuclease E [Mycobacteroides franklinii]|nr:ribonuclease E [Mycobacteroides franklinii]
MRAAGAPVQFGQRVEHAACGGSENAREGVHPQLLGQFPLLSRGLRGVRR